MKYRKLGHSDLVVWGEQLRMASANKSGFYTQSPTWEIHSESISGHSASSREQEYNCSWLSFDLALPGAKQRINRVSTTHHHHPKFFGFLLNPLHHIASVPHDHISRSITRPSISAIPSLTRVSANKGQLV